MNGFEQIKSFYTWVFNNPDKARPTHVSLYLFLWNQANRANWVEWFKCPYDLAMQGACIGNNGTYYRCLDELKEWGLIDYQKGINNYKAPLIHLICLYNSEQQTEQVTVPQSEQQTEQLSEQQTEQLPVHIYKLITNNLKPIMDRYNDFEKIVHDFANLHSDKNKTWKTNFEIYKSELRDVYNQLKKDSEYILTQEKYHPGVDIILSIEKACVNFWATEAGWKHKKKKKIENIDWKSTLTNAIDLNKVYKPKDNGSTLPEQSAATIANLVRARLHKQQP